MDNVKQTFVRLGRRCPAVLYEPEEAGPTASIAVLVMHSDEDYLTASTGMELAKRGFTVLCANVEIKEGMLFTMPQKLGTVEAAVRFLRDIPGVKKVVLMGHSGGGTLMTCYQKIADSGVSSLRDSAKLVPYPDDVVFTGADGIMLFDSNWGNAAMQLFSIDPAVTDETSGRNLNPDLDLFNPANGFDPKGSDFPEEFIRKYQRGQSARNNRLIDLALERYRLIKEGKGNFIDDEPFFIPGAYQCFMNNKLFAQDIKLMSHTAKPQKLIHADGSITKEIVKSVRRPENPESLTPKMWDGSIFLSVNTFLTSYAVRTDPDFGYDEDHLWGIDWDSSYACPPGNVVGIKCPMLVVGMTAGWEFLASETIYDMSTSKDKDLAFVEGATHTFETASNLEEYPGQFGDTMKTLHDYAAVWLSADGRF